VEVEAVSEQTYQDASAVLNSIFSGPMPTRSGHGPSRITGPVPVPPRSAPRTSGTSIAAGASVAAGTSIAATVAAAMTPPVVAPPVSIPGAQITGSAQIPVPPPQPGRVPPPPVAGNSSETGRMRLEILRLHSQIKKLEAELVAEREYTKALEQHVTSLQESE
jgi:hypothetical protein